MATSIEHYVNHVTALTSGGNYADLGKFVRNSTELLKKNISILDTVLATLQPTYHTLGVLAVLKIRLQHITRTDTNADTLHATCVEFINVADPVQIKYAPDLMGELCCIYTDLLIAAKCPMRGLEVLHMAIQKLQESKLCLTSVHCKLLQLCLLTKCFKPALKVLDVDYIDISRENGYIAVEHFLLYYYYGGMVYTALKNYKRAQYLFQVCISTPAMAVSMIMVEAFKKFILVSLIAEGKVGNVPKYASLVFNRLIKPLSTAYLKLGQAYSTYNPEKLTAVINKHQEIFLRDDNVGLVKQCAYSLNKTNIHRLKQTFVTLSLVDVAHRCQLASPEEAQKYILNMIEDGEIDASINQKDGMVDFYESINPDKYNSPEILNDIHDQISKCIAVEHQIAKLDEKIMLNPSYIQKVFCPQDDDGSPPLQVVSQGNSTLFSSM